MDPTLIKAAINQVMPFGKYAGRRLFHLPETLFGLVSQARLSRKQAW